MHFETYEDLARHEDCKYVFEVNCEVSSLVRRVESLNLVGGLLWPKPLPQDFKSFRFRVTNGLPLPPMYS
jgi:hypothetical protein